MDDSLIVGFGHSTTHSMSSDGARWKYHVFLSFRGEDTRFKFTDHLYHAFCRAGIHAFRDKEKLRTGDEIAPALLSAIEESRISIVVFSKNYASSAWCLDELVKILECKKEKMQIVLPIFYEVDPSEFRHKTGSFGNASAINEDRFRDSIEKVQKWRLALREAANLSWEYYKNDQYESKFIKKIIQKISSILNQQLLHITEHAVGLESRRREIVSLLSIGSKNHGVCMVGIYGIGGIGKTTIAKEVYNVVAAQFEKTSFVAEVRENSIKHGIAYIQETILTDILGEKDIKLSNVHKGIQLMQERLRSKRILLVLDDVDKLQQLQLLAGGGSWFGSGSRIVITTRDKQLLRRHGIQKMYEVKELDDHEALELLCWNAFGKSEATTDFLHVSTCVLRYAEGIPLALEIIGSDLFGKDTEVWECTLDKYEKNMNRDIFSKLKVSYENLEYNEKEIFLHLACFFKGESLDYIEKILGGCDLHPNSGLSVLQDKCFIKIQNNRLWMHDLIVSMGKEIVRQESEQEPHKRSRLWFHEDALQVLTNDMGSSTIKGIMLDLPRRKVVPWSGNAFKKMINLRILIIRNARFLKAPKQLPNSLCVIEWNGYPSSSLPSSFSGNKLLDFQLPYATHPMQLQLQFKKFQNISVLALGGCEWIKEIPDVSAIPNLTELHLDFCYNLVKIHDSVGFLDKLVWFYAWNCVKLKEFPTGNGLKSLRLLDLGGCASIERIPNLSGAKALVFVILSNTGIDVESDSGRQLLQGLLERNYVLIITPGVRIPRCFRHRRKRSSFSFWIRRQVPDICVCFVLRERNFGNEEVILGVSVSIGNSRMFNVDNIAVPKDCCGVWTFRLPHSLPERSVILNMLRNWVRVDISLIVTSNPSKITCGDRTPGVIVEECGVFVDPGSSAQISFIDPDSQYSIKNRRIAVTSGERNDAFSSSSNPLWKEVACLNIPPQVKHFAWAAFCHRLPSKRKLRKRCDRCGLRKETTLHVLKECQWARGVWLLSPLGLKVDRIQARDFMEWMRELVGILDTESLELVMVIAWGLWDQRDKLLLGRKTEDPRSLVVRLGVFPEEHKRTHKSVSQTANRDDHALKRGKVCLSCSPISQGGHQLCHKGRKSWHIQR